MHSAPSHDHPDDPLERKPMPRVSAGNIALAVFLAIALFFLITEHRAHLYGALPYLFLLACPLMHMFHHHGHGGHGHHGTASRPNHSKRRPEEGDLP